ncbi:LacI family transcriptional regulator [Candidimonas nitroreducens]|uniref:LacI family transcriptional regulator n=2 Tax=Candidimonas nitroreducens TaxID=683354 RepID=A0A225MU37_9BURK|nr:LacI family transcriptional regulator [Candidimonas nitroreducens]
MATVGRLAGVSQVTVSRALSDPSKVSPATMRRIRDAIDITGFVPNAVAGALASRRSKLISALVPSLTNTVYASMMQSFSDLMRDNGYELLLSECGFQAETEEKLIAAHLSRRPDAFYLTGIHHTTRARQMLIGADIPVVEVWDLTDTPIDICVGFDHREVGRAMADFAADAGYRHAATVGAGDARALRRRDAFADRFAARGGTCAGDVTFQDSASVAHGREGLSRLIDEHGFSSGVIACSSDLMAEGILIEAQKRRLSVPDQIGVLGFGDQDFAAHLEPALSTVRVDRPALGTTAAQAVLKRLHGSNPEHSRVDIGFQLIRRGSA